jgi:tripartite-type tricarboxylate transporter receptor subunit TctC
MRRGRGMPGLVQCVLAAAACLAGAALVCAGAAAAPYPERPITIIVPFTPGGPTDLVARILAGQLGERIGQPAVVENRPGAGGNIGIIAVARAKPDGYTLLVSSSAFVVNPSLYSHATYDPFKDFAPVAYFGSSPNALAIRPELGIDSLAELIRRAKKEPDLFNYASPGSGTTPQLAAELLKFRAGITIVHVPYGGAAPAAQAILSGTTQLALMNLATLLPHMKAGTLKGLVQTGEVRWPDLPDVPTMAEAGFPNAVSETFQILLAPAGTPPAIVDRLAKEAVAIFDLPEIRERLLQAGFGVAPQGPDWLRARIAAEVPMWREVIKTAGIKVE